MRLADSSSADTVWLIVAGGINVGRAKRIAMADLRALVEGLGYGDVKTLLNSGNVVFTAPSGGARAAAARIEAAIAEQLGVRSRVTVVTGAELDAVVRDNPIADVGDDPSRLLVAFLADAADRARLAPVEQQTWEEETFAPGARVAYMWCPAGVLASKLPEAVGRALGDAVTTRNWATVLKLHALTRQASARDAR